MKSSLWMSRVCNSPCYNQVCLQYYRYPLFINNKFSCVWWPLGGPSSAHTPVSSSYSSHFAQMYSIAYVLLFMALSADLGRLQSHENQLLIQRLSSVVKRTTGWFFMYFVTLIGNLQHAPCTVSSFVDSTLTLTHKLQLLIRGIAASCLSFLSFLKS